MDLLDPSNEACGAIQNAHNFADVLTSEMLV